MFQPNTCPITLLLKACWRTLDKALVASKNVNIGWQDFALFRDDEISTVSFAPGCRSPMHRTQILHAHLQPHPLFAQSLPILQGGLHHRLENVHVFRETRLIDNHPVIVVRGIFQHLNPMAGN